MPDDPIKRMIREEIERIRAEGRGIRPDEIEAAVQARVDALSPEETRALLTATIEAGIESGDESPGDMVAKLFHPKRED